jgi:hypothetical protein
LSSTDSPPKSCWRWKVRDSSVRRTQPGDGVEQRGLACPVGTDKPEHLAAARLDADAVDRYDAGEADLNVPDAERHGGRRLIRGGGLRSGDRHPLRTLSPVRSAPLSRRSR